jgi:hypothetical protein
MSGSSTANRGHDVPHLSSRRCSAHERRPRCLSGVQRSGGPCNRSSARTVQQWSVIPAAIAGVVALLAWARRAGGGQQVSTVPLLDMPDWQVSVRRVHDAKRSRNVVFRLRHSVQRQR